MQCSSTDLIRFYFYFFILFAREKIKVLNERNLSLPSLFLFFNFFFFFFFLIVRFFVLFLNLTEAGKNQKMAKKGVNRSSRNRKPNHQQDSGSHEDIDYRKGASIKAINTWEDIGGNSEDECKSHS
jgi:hypothetical protein